MSILSYKSFLAFSVLLTSLLFFDKLSLLFNNVTVTYLHTSKELPNHIFTVETLRKFNGISDKKLYLALLGKVFDVSSGQRHYGKEGAYNYFIGKDGSRSFITGDFRDNTVNSDHVLDRSCEEIYTLDHWVTVMKEKYKEKGILVGRYFDINGKETEYSRLLEQKIKECEVQKQMAEIDKLKYPPCNMEWSADKGSRVWCSKTSGGTTRSWVGVPRQRYTPGEKLPKCVCYNPTNGQDPELREYKNCSPTSTSCNINS